MNTLSTDRRQAQYSSPSPYLVVMAGGSGTRFWPKSTSRRPKQLLSFGGETESNLSQKSPSLLEQTLNRFDGWIPSKNTLIVTTQLLEPAIHEMISPEIQILAEPSGRNTAPCVYWAARAVAEKDPKGIMVIVPSDHFIAYAQKFVSVVQEAFSWAVHHDDLITLGIKPTRPETGYGYLQIGQQLTGGRPGGPSRVEAFIEKPGFDKARELVESGTTLWNGGMFVWRVNAILKAFDQWMPEYFKTWEQAQGQVAQAYPQMTATSIDYAIMEKAKNVVTFPLDCGWDDVGSWNSLESLSKELGAQQGSNVVTGGQLVAIDSERNIIDTPGRVIALLGIEDLVVVEHGEALLIAKKDRTQEIRKVVEAVKLQRPELV